MVARSVIAVGVGLITVSAWASEPLRFVQEPEGSAMPVPVADSAAGAASPAPAAPQSTTGWRSSANNRTSRRHLSQAAEPAKESASEIFTATDEAPPEPVIPPPAHVLPSTSKTKVVTIVRPKQSTPTLAKPKGTAHIASRSNEPHLAPPRPSTWTPTSDEAPEAEQPTSPKRRLVQSDAGAANVSSRSSSEPHLAPPRRRESAPTQAEQAANDSTAAFAEPTPVADAPVSPRGSIAGTSDSPTTQAASELVQPMRKIKRHLLPSMASKPQEGDEGMSPKTSARLAITSRNREPEQPAAQSRRESGPVPTLARRPAPLADEQPAASLNQDVAANEADTSDGETFRFRFSTETESAPVESTPEPFMTKPTPVAQSTRPATRPRPEPRSRLAEQSTEALELRAADPSSTDGGQRVPVASRPATAPRQPLATRLSELHPTPAKTVARAAKNQHAGTPSVAMADGGDGEDRAAEIDSPPAAAKGKQLAAAAKASPAAASRPAPVSKGAVIDVDRSRQTARLVFGTQPPPVGSIIKVEHTGWFGGSQVATLRVVRVQSGEVLAKPANDSAIQRLSRGDQAFYRLAPPAEKNQPAATVARAPATGGSIGLK
jgi:hypothetical protein